MIKKLLVSLLILFAPLTANAAIAFDASSEFSNSVGNCGGANPCNKYWTQTISASATLLIVCVGAEGASGRFLNAFAGKASGTSTMTLLTSAGNGNANVAMYYLLNPPTGTVTIQTQTDDTGTIPLAMGMAASYTGTKTSSFPDSSASPTGTSATTFAPSTTVVGTGAWLVTCTANNQNNALGAGAGTVGRQGVFDNGNLTAYVLSDSNGTVGTGSQSLNITSGSAATWQGIIASFIPPSTVQPSFGYFWMFWW